MSISILSISVGAGKSVITYPEDFFPYAGFRGRYLTGIHDDIYARAIVVSNPLQTLLIISVELGDITGEWIPEISRHTGIPEDNIYLTATHTHEAPYANSTWGERVDDEEKTKPFCACCLRAVLNAADEAIRTSRPARMGIGTGSCGVNVSRVHAYNGSQPHFTAPYISAPNEHEYSDHTVFVIKFEDMTGQPIACLVNFPVHSSVQFRQSWDHSHGNLISGDLSGAAMRYVEERMPGAVSLMTLGAAGDQIPRAVMLQPVFDKNGNMEFRDYGDETGYAFSEVLGTELGEEILYIAGNTASTLASADLGVYKIVQTVNTKQPWEGGPPFALPHDYEYQPDGSMDITLRLMKIGPVALIGIPGELVASVGTQLKDILRSSGFEHPAVVTQCNGAVQYISDLSGYERKTFEAIESHFMPDIVDALKAGAKNLASFATP